MNARTTNHDMADDMAQWGAELNAGRVGKLTGAELNRAIADRAAPMTWLPRRCDLNCDQGRRCTCAPSPAECCTEIGADGVPGTWESADGEVLPVFLLALASLLCLLALIWATGP
ncbi:MAG: hypothetical protein IV107_16485 [Paucibacter sp.]|nr:hypothetical protein [Roseateles sp.]